MQSTNLQSYLHKHYKIIIFSGILLLFILGFLPQNLLWIILSTLLLIIVVSVVSLYQKNYPKNSVQEIPIEEVESTTAQQDWMKIENDQDVEHIFQLFLENSLQLIKQVLVTNTVVLLFINYSKKEFSIRHRVTKHPESLIPQNTFDLSKGLPGLVLRNRQALIENHLPPGQEIIPYYRTNDNPARSFAAVPVYYKDFIFGILCIDSDVEEAFSNDDLDILKNFGNLISIQLFGSNKLYEYEAENWLANTLFEVSQQMNQLASVDQLWNYLMKKIPDIIQCDRLSISEKLNDTTAQIVQINGGIGNLKNYRQFSLNEGIVGWVIRKNQPLLVEDFSNKENYVPRFFSQETPAAEYLSLLALPITSGKNVLGAICLESFKPKNFKEQHKRILLTICNHAATIYLTNQSIHSLRQISFKDPELDIENINAFKYIFPKEYHRATRLNYPVSLLYIRSYLQMKEPSSTIENHSLNDFLTLILPLIDKSDYIFRLSKDTFAILLCGADGLASKAIAENIVQKVSDKKVWADGSVVDFYVNIGIVSHSWLTGDGENALELGEQTVNQAKQQGMNKIAHYSPTATTENK